MVTNANPRPRGRPRKLIADTPVVTVEETNEVKAAFEARPSMRPDLRDDDPRARAARRAAELRGHLGDMDTGTDDFYVDVSRIPDGWTYEWKRKLVFGLEDPSYQVALAHMGWEPVPASRHPEMMPTNMTSANIERKGMILMERPAEITEEVRENERQKARNQVRVKEQQLSSAPDGTMTRDHAQARPNIRKSYSPVDIPKE